MNKFYVLVINQRNIHKLHPFTHRVGLIQINTFATKLENLGIPRNHISQLMGHEDSNMALDVYSSGLAIEPLVESINKLTFGEEVDSYIKEAISEKLNVEAKDKINDMELLAKLQTSESILGSRILRNVREGE